MYYWVEEDGVLCDLLVFFCRFMAYDVMSNIFDVLWVDVLSSFLVEDDAFEKGSTGPYSL